MKVDMDCMNCLECSGRSCCTLKIHPFGLEMICTKYDSGTCSIEDIKPISCRLYPFLLVTNDDGRVILCVDTNCPQWEKADLAQALETIIEHGDELVIITEQELEFFNFNVRILGPLT